MALDCMDQDSVAIVRKVLDTLYSPVVGQVRLKASKADIALAIEHFDNYLASRTLTTHGQLFLLDLMHNELNGH